MQGGWGNMKVKAELKRRLEAFLDELVLREQEMGGYLLKSRRGIVSEFLPIPNVSEKPRTSYRMPPRSKDLAEQLARSRSMTVEAHFHSHPDPCIMSAADQCYAEATDLTCVAITPT
jgi:proteasome lid subunit RPN8/RPN11